MADAFAAMTRQLTGTAPPAMPVACTADDLRVVVNALRQDGRAACVRHADALAAHLAGRGKLEPLLGIAGQRGRRNLAGKARKAMRDEALRSLAECFAGPGVSRSARAARLGEFLRTRPHMAEVIRARTGAAVLPTSRSALAAILRE